MVKLPIPIPGKHNFSVEFVKEVYQRVFKWLFLGKTPPPPTTTTPPPPPTTTTPPPPPNTTPSPPSTTTPFPPSTPASPASPPASPPSTPPSLPSTPPPSPPTPPSPRSTPSRIESPPPPPLEWPEEEGTDSERFTPGVSTQICKTILFLMVFGYWQIARASASEEEHHVSKLHLVWPQVSCLSGYPSRGSLVVIASYINSQGEKQKFALRFSTPSETEDFITSMEDILSGTNPASCFPHSAVGYEASFYSRIWSKVFAADLYASKFHDGILNHHIGMQFRNKVGATRRKLAVANGQRCKDVNVPLLENLVLLRHKFARLLGYDNYAEYVCSRMAKTSSKDIKLLLDDIAALKPTVFCAVPCVLDRIYSGLQVKLRVGGLLMELGGKSQQKFALRFSTPSEAENFITSMEDILSGKFPTEISAVIDSPTSSQSIVADTEINGVVFPPHFTSLVCPEQSELALALVLELQDPDLKSEMAKYMQDASFLGELAHSCA